MRHSSLPIACILALVLSLAGANAQEKPAASPFVVDRDSEAVSRRDAKGKLVWSRRLGADIGLVRPPYLQWDEKRVYISHNGGVTALDSASGAIQWQSKGPSDRLLLSGDLLLAADCSSEPSGERRLLARGVIKGNPVFIVKLPSKEFDAQPIQEVAGLFLVQKAESPQGTGKAFLVDRGGKVRFAFDRQVVAGLTHGDDRLFLTSIGVSRVSAMDAPLWSFAFPQHQWLSAGGFVTIPGGDLLVFRYGRITDSGVDMIRFNPKSGKPSWEAHCDGLGLIHSAFTNEAAVTLDGNQVRVRCQFGGRWPGTITETRDAKSGKGLTRAVLLR